MGADDPRRQLEHFRHRTLRELEYQRSIGRLEPVEFDRRAGLARSAASTVDLRPLLADLVHTSERALAPRPGPAGAASLPSPTAGGDDAGSDFAFALMSSSVREGHWQPPRTLHAVAIMGGVKLDFRDADLLAGTTHVRAFALMGGISVLVPPDVRVVVKGFGLMGGFGRARRTSAAPDAPCILIDGIALMGGVDVKVRASGSGDEPT
jgi:hypothetical protein